ncbi:MAG: hypothetical protein LBK76_10850 [Verrucomicrobiales bacterium]|jgi:hypothetical protein|nr:hypothetical protein [Verrucomicrobiales bacterium]
MNGPHIKVLDYEVANRGADTVLTVTVHEGQIFSLHFDKKEFLNMVAYVKKEIRGKKK